MPTKVPEMPISQNHTFLPGVNLSGMGMGSAGDHFPHAFQPLQIPLVENVLTKPEDKLKKYSG